MAGGSGQGAERLSTLTSAQPASVSRPRGKERQDLPVSARFRIQFDGEPSPRAEDFASILAAEVWAATENLGVTHRIWVESGSER